MGADRGQRFAQPAADTTLADAEVRRDLPIGEAAKVRQLDGLLLVRWQRVECFVHRLPHHRTREIVPRLGAIDWADRPFDQHFLEVLMGAPYPATVEWSTANARHQPGAPGIARRRGQHYELGLFHRRVFAVATVATRLRTRPGEPPIQH
jgi:hypothetical protein